MVHADKLSLAQRGGFKAAFQKIGSICPQDWNRWFRPNSRLRGGSLRIRQAFASWHQDGMIGKTDLY